MTTAARTAIVAAAKSVVGWTAPAQNYLTLIDPGDPTDRERQVAEESDCGLVLLGIEEIALTITPPRGPYVDGSAFELVYQRAGGNPWAPGGAFRLPTFAEPPQEGDGIEYGPAPSGSPPAHMEHVITVTISGTTMTLSCVAGGEKNSQGLETVAIMERTLHWNGSQWVDTANGRPLIGIVDADLLAAIYPLKSDDDCA